MKTLINEEPTPIETVQVEVEKVIEDKITKPEPPSNKTIIILIIAVVVIMGIWIYIKIKNKHTNGSGN